jgi:hypothetical protein
LPEIKRLAIIDEKREAGSPSLAVKPVSQKSSLLLEGVVKARKLVSPFEKGDKGDLLSRI